MNPNLNFAQFKRGIRLNQNYNHSGIIDFKDIYQVLTLLQTINTVLKNNQN